MNFIIILFAAYLVSAAVVLAGMILTPTRSSRQIDARAREQYDGDELFEMIYLVAKANVALLWPWFYLKSLLNDRRAKRYERTRRKIR